MVSAVERKPRIVVEFSQLGRHFSRRKDSGRNLTKNIKFLRAPSFRIGWKSQSKGYIQLKEWKIIPSLRKPRAGNLKQKKEKKKRELWIQTPYWSFYFKKLFLYCTTFFIRFGPTVICPFDFPILSFYFILYLGFNQMLCFYLNYAQWNLCYVCIKFISFEINSLLWDKSVCHWNIVGFFCMSIFKLLLPFPFLIRLFYYLYFSLLPYGLLLSWTAKFEALLTSLLLFLNTRVARSG